MAADISPPDDDLSPPDSPFHGFSIDEIPKPLQVGTTYHMNTVDLN